MSILASKLNCFKSPLRVTANRLLKIRDNLQYKIWGYKHDLAQAKRNAERSERRIERLIHENDQLKKQIMEEKQKPCRLPDDPPIDTHGYGPRMIELAINIAKVSGLRTTEKTLEVVFTWLGIKQKTPCYQSIRNWMIRLGVAVLDEKLEKVDDRVWFVDHSNQIGQERVLAELPEQGQAIRHEDMAVLRLEPGVSWKTEDMAVVYQELAEKYGVPRAIICDGASPLKNGAKELQKKYPHLIVLRDFKHKAANIFESIIGKSEPFKQLISQIGVTCSAIQQTKLE